MKTFLKLQEGVYDPNIFKAFFLAGGPGSGKSFVVRKTTGGLGLRIVNSDVTFEKLIKDADIDLDFRNMSPEREKERDVIRAKAKAITQRQQSNLIAGRLGLVIDGTGKEYDKISSQATGLRNLGYETYMIFVNTSLDTALDRNNKRARKLPANIVKDSWNGVQKNIGKFQNFFGGRNFIIVDNNKADEDVFNKVFKVVKKLANKKVTNYIATTWVQQQLDMKKILGQRK